MLDRTCINWTKVNGETKFNGAGLGKEKRCRRPAGSWVRVHHVVGYLIVDESFEKRSLFPRVVPEANLHGFSVHGRFDRERQ